ncbi:hypothetical protein GGF31_001418 [Allomyces arbusculus]|nr:hypothetical protein GGF31_001418 [Allomyces arbusculus]
MSFRGTSVGQNTKFSNKEQKLLKSIKFPAVYAQPINVQAINMDAMRDWAAKRIFELLGVDDDIVTEMVFEYLAEDNLDPRRLHINLMPFLEAKTTTFMKELWKLLVSASTSLGGIPREFVEARKRDILAAQGDQQRLIQDMDANAAAVQEHGYHALQPLGTLPPRPHHTPAQFDPADRARPCRPATTATSRAPHAIAAAVTHPTAVCPASVTLEFSAATPYCTPWSVTLGLAVAVAAAVPPQLAIPLTIAAPPWAQQLPFALTLAVSFVVAVALPAPPSPRELVPVSIALGLTVALSAATPPPVDFVLTGPVTVPVAVPSPSRAQSFAVPLAVSLAATQS